LAAGLGLAAGVYLLKAAGPVVLGNRKLPPLVASLAALAPAALLAALVLISGFSERGRLLVDARAAGVAAGMVALALRAPFVAVVVVSVIATAVVRAI
jgi:branched-subunit amino acid transport protein